MSFQFPHPVMNWNAPDQFAELSRFKDHCMFIFNGLLSGTTEKQKCGWVGTWIGGEGREICKTLQIAEADDVGVVFRKFEEYVRPKKNKRMSRHKLKNRKQTSTETFTNYVKDLKVILMDCEYENPKDILIGCIIDGVADAKLQEKLLDRGEGLTLAKALELGQHHHEKPGQSTKYMKKATYLGKFIPNLSQEDQPLRQLLKAENIFQWEDRQEKAFDKLKDLCVKAPVLQYFDVNKPVEVHCDASSTGLGAVLVQDNKPVAYSSRSLTDTETRYAQIEKEMLAIVHACKKFHCFIFGKEVTVFTDHKPLEQIFTKQLLAAPMRLQRMLLTLQWYDITVTYRKGKDMQIPDTLSRAYLQESVAEIDINQVNASEFLNITDEKYKLFQAKTDDELKLLHQTILEGWTEERKLVPREVQPYFESRSELSVVDGIIFKAIRIVLQPSLRMYALDLIHNNQMGIVKCKQRGREVFFWPNINAEIEQKVRNCELCAATSNKQPAEPLKYTMLPKHPFAEIAADYSSSSP
ncbi:transposon Ty3-I Gag-Pol polyprotein [Elysia marginata]|uniref:Transposon Ty3-I Gag-Pol polyprotein n=1 Tax=Elysia marginata TaxID=1093978 RepID=A0AAV4I813_9GAST|nr:transposon Ty3-I Gag-Pol polyprotein [Elysia marginata]